MRQIWNGWDSKLNECKSSPLKVSIKQDFNPKALDTLMNEVFKNKEALIVSGAVYKSWFLDWIPNLPFSSEL